MEVSAKCPDPEADVIPILRKFLPSIVIGSVEGFNSVTFALAVAALLFAGPLASGVGLGLGAGLLGGAILALAVALRSEVPNSIAHGQETTVAILSAAILAMVLQSADSTAVNVATALAIVGLSSIATGVLFWLCGRFRLGGLVRFLPYPVVAGFQAGSGWLLIDGAANMLTGHPIGPNFLAALGTSAVLMQVLAAVMFALTLLAGLKRYANPFTMAVIMLAAVLLFYGTLDVSGLQISDARALGHLPAQTGGAIQLPTLDLLQQVNWGAVVGIVPVLLVVAGLNMVGFMLNISGLELALRRDIDINAELRSSGWANLLSGGVGGPSGYLGLGMTVLADRMGARRRAVGISLALVMVLAALLGGELVLLVPVFMTTGFILYLGFDLMGSWLFATRTTMPLLEWGVVVLIVLAICLIGFMEGIGVGILLSSVLFVFKYAQLPVIRFRATAAQLRSSVDRSPEDGKRLAELGGGIEIVQLQSYLFFGTAERVVDIVRQRLADAGKPPTVAFILDFERVSGADSAAISCMVKIRALAERQGCIVFFSHLDQALERQLALAGLVFDEHGSMRLEPDFDRALEAGEALIINAPSAIDAHDPADAAIADFLVALIGPHPRIEDLIGAMERRLLHAGETLIGQGERSQDVFFIARGQVSVHVPLPGGGSRRVRTMLAGAVVGEMALYLNQERSADVIVDTRSQVYVLSACHLQDLERDDPRLALVAHRLLACALAEKLIIANQATQLRLR